ncbi:HNH endonuclease signature motif containing protein, partial [Microbacterium sp. P5_E9]
LTEDDQTAVPAWLIAQQACEVGTIECTIDRDGNPLYLGREQRLFSAKQRLTLAIRDGGCRWRGCDRPPSYCEAHHLDPYAEGGCTDVDRGILLCRYHHMALHHGGWRITRTGLGEFVLHPPEGQGDPIILMARLPLRYAWADVDPPRLRFRRAA